MGAITTRKRSGGRYDLVDATGATVGAAWKNGMRNTAGRAWTYRLTGQGERKAGTLRGCADAAERVLTTGR